jgi:hypothetical protein
VATVPASSGVSSPAAIDFAVDYSPLRCCTAAFDNPYVSLKRSRWGAGRFRKLPDPETSDQR